MISGDQSYGVMDLSVYQYDYIIVPAASQKTLNPDLQFMKWRDAFMFAIGNLQLVPNMNVEAELRRGLSMFDPQLMQTLMIDPNKAGPAGQPPIYRLLDGINKAIGQNYQIDEQQQKELESTMKLAIETADKLEEQSKKDKDAILEIVQTEMP